MIIYGEKSPCWLQSSGGKIWDEIWKMATDQLRTERWGMRHVYVWEMMMMSWWWWWLLCITQSHVCMHAKLIQLCLTLCDSNDCSLPGSSVCGILQARILEWVAMHFSRGSSQPRGQTRIFCVSYIGRHVLYHQHHLGNHTLPYDL